MAILTIGGKEMPAPSEMSVEMQEIGSSGERSASGRLVADRVAVKRRLKLKWAALAGDAAKALLSAADGFFTATYPDPATGAARSATFSRPRARWAQCGWTGRTPYGRTSRWNGRSDEGGDA